MIAIGCESDHNLGAAIGIGEDGAERLRPFLDQSGPARKVPTTLTPSQLLDEYAYDGPDGVKIMLGARAEKAGSG